MDESQTSDQWDVRSERVLIQNFPVHRACRDGDVEQLGSLLSTGEVDLYEEDDFYGWTPLHWAAYFGKLSCLMKLVEHGAICDAPTERLNQTAAHIAAYGGDSRCLQWLLQSGALICRQDYMGETPCHKAARTGSMECISLLVSQGADLSVRNLSGNTVSQVAAAAGYPECANYLERAALVQASKKTSSATDSSNETVYMANGETGSSQGPPAAQRNFISTNTYHSNPYVSCNGDGQVNGFGCQSALNNNNSSNSNGCHDNDCDMEMEDGGADPNWLNKCNGASKGTEAGDVLLDQGVSRNLVPLAGKKRGREDVEEECFKRARNDDYCFQNGAGFAIDPPFISSGMDYNDNMPQSIVNGHGAVENCHSVTCENGVSDRSDEFTMQEIHSVEMQPEIRQSFRQEPVSSCLRYKDQPVKCINFMSHYI